VGDVIDLETIRRHLRASAESADLPLADRPATAGPWSGVLAGTEYRGDLSVDEYGQESRRWDAARPLLIVFAGAEPVSGPTVIYLPSVEDFAGELIIKDLDDVSSRFPIRVVAADGQSIDGRPMREVTRRFLRLLPVRLRVPQGFGIWLEVG